MKTKNIENIIYPSPQSFLAPTEIEFVLHEPIFGTFQYFRARVNNTKIRN